MNEKELVEKLKDQNIVIWFSDEYLNTKPMEQATHFGAAIFEPSYINISEKMPKKGLTIEKVVEKILKKQNVEYIDYGKVFHSLKLNNVHFHTTTYGIGIEVIFGDKPKTIETIKSFLDANGIVYTNEYSDAMWVYRFKISKAKENLEKIKKLFPVA